MYDSVLGGLNEIMLGILGGTLVVMMMVMRMGGVVMMVMRMVVIMMTMVVLIVALMTIILVTIKDAHCEMQKVSSVPLRGRVRSGEAKRVLEEDVFALASALLWTLFLAFECLLFKLLPKQPSSSCQPLVPAALLPCHMLICSSTF